MGLQDNIAINIQQTLEIAQRNDGFWARWLVHGLLQKDVDAVRNRCTTLESWVSEWSELAQEKEKLAHILEEQNLYSDAEEMYRLSSLYYILAQYIYPTPTPDRKKLTIKSQDLSIHADALSQINTSYHSLHVGEHTCFGRVRIPYNSSGCIILINPIDSPKEELFSYEKDFLNAGLTTISFDGPGQGGTFTFQGIKATQKQLQSFVDEVVDFTAKKFSSAKINLFGTSSGGGWAIYGSCNMKVAKVAAVSPAIGFYKMHFSDYFRSRFAEYLADDCAPSFERLQYLRPVWVFHGGKDKMIPEKELHQIYDRLPEGKQYTEYPDESHCCNFELSDIRQSVAAWFKQ
jgi:pimeloyl-ACP methyl ester carboxylesterase